MKKITTIFHYFGFILLGLFGLFVFANHANAYYTISYDGSSFNVDSLAVNVEWNGYGDGESGGAKPYFALNGTLHYDYDYGAVWDYGLDPMSGEITGVMVSGPSLSLNSFSTSLSSGGENKFYIHSNNHSGDACGCDPVFGSAYDAVYAKITFANGKVLYTDADTWLGSGMGDYAITPMSISCMPDHYIQNAVCGNCCQTDVYKTITVSGPITNSCTGSVPANASIFAGDNTGLTVNTAYTYWATDTGTRCQYSCNNGFDWNGSICRPAVCFGPIPANTAPFPGDKVGLTADTRRSHSEINNAPKCQFHCNGGYSWNSSACVFIPGTPVCTGSVPANASIFDGDDVGLTADTSYNYWATDTGTRCQYSCDSGYAWNGSSCVANATYSCTTGFPSTNATAYADGDETTGLAANTTWTYAVPDTAIKCQFYCNTFYHWSSPNCLVNTCQGSPATNAVVWANDDINLPDNTTQYSYYASDTGTRCQYRCNSTSTWNGSSCVATLPACSDDCPASYTPNCSVNNLYTCGNFDADSCLDLSSTTCPYGCSAGVCNPSGSNTLTPGPWKEVAP